MNTDWLLAGWSEWRGILFDRRSLFGAKQTRMDEWLFTTSALLAPGASLPLRNGAAGGKPIRDQNSSIIANSSIEVALMPRVAPERGFHSLGPGRPEG